MSISREWWLNNGTSVQWNSMQQNRVRKYTNREKLPRCIIMLRGLQEAGLYTKYLPLCVAACTGGVCLFKGGCICITSLESCSEGRKQEPQCNVDGSWVTGERARCRNHQCAPFHTHFILSLVTVLPCQ